MDRTEQRQSLYQGTKVTKYKVARHKATRQVRKENKAILRDLTRPTATRPPKITVQQRAENTEDLDPKTHNQPKRTNPKTPTYLKINNYHYNTHLSYIPMYAKVSLGIVKAPKVPQSTATVRQSSPMYPNVPECARMSPKCTRMYLNVPGLLV